jgi:hypothetical protein
MGIVAGRHHGPPPGEDQIIAPMPADDPAPHAWGNAPADSYGWHEHSYGKVLYCIRGRITFHAGSGDADLGPGDQLVLPAHAPHVATIGADGVRCGKAPDANLPNTRSGLPAGRRCAFMQPASGTGNIVAGRKSGDMAGAACDSPVRG